MTNKFLNWIFLLIISTSTALVNTYFSVAQFDMNKEFEKSLQNVQNQFILLKKKTDKIDRDVTISEKEINDVKQNTNLAVLKCYSEAILDDYQSSVISSNFNVPDIEELSYYYLDIARIYNFFNLIEISPSASLYENMLIGRLPSNKGEVMISSLLADYIIRLKENGAESDKFYSYDDIVRNNFEIKITNTKCANVVGIIKYDTSKYEDLKFEYPTRESLTGENIYTPNKDKNISNRYQEFVDSTFGYQNIYVHPDFIDSLSQNKEDYVTSLQVYIESNEQILSLSEQYKISENGLYIYSNFSRKFFESIISLKCVSKVFLYSGLTMIVLTTIIRLLINKNKYFSKREVIAGCGFITVFSLTFTKLANKIFLNNPVFLFSKISLSFTVVLVAIEISVILLLTFYLTSRGKKNV